MKRIVSRFLATTIAKKGDHSNKAFLDAGTACSRDNFSWSMQFYPLCSENKCHQLRVYNQAFPADFTVCGHNFVLQRNYSTQPVTEDENVQLESQLRRKVGWLLKILAAVTITYVSFNAFPIMGDSLIWQSVALVRLDDTFMKRSGASRISMIATNDRRRKNFVEAGAVTELAKMLQSASEDKTRGEAVKALVSLCECEVAVEALDATGAEGLLKSLSQDSSESAVQSQSLVLLKKLEEWKGRAK